VESVLLAAVMVQCLDGEGGRVRMALLAADLSGPTASSLRPPRFPAPPLPPMSAKRTVGSMMVRVWRNWTVPAFRSRSAHSRPHSSPLRAPVAAARTVQTPSHGLEVWPAASSSTATCSGASVTAWVRGTGGGGGVGGGVVSDQPPGDCLGEGAVRAAVHAQDVLGGQPPGLPSRRPLTARWS
jgi:hypothetical protein